MSNTPWTAFISYHSKDELFAIDVKKYLIEKGIKVHMYDTHNKWNYTFGSMVLAIKNSMFVVYASPTATDDLNTNIENASSRYVKIELKAAEILKKNVIGISKRTFVNYDREINANNKLFNYYENVSAKLMEAVYLIYPDKYDYAMNEEGEERYMFSKEMPISQINLLEKMQTNPTWIVLILLFLLNYVLFSLVVIGIIQPILYFFLWGRY